MAAIYNSLSHDARAPRRDAARHASRLKLGSRLRALPANALRQAQEILCALWMFAVLAFSLVIAVGFVA